MFFCQTQNHTIGRFCCFTSMVLSVESLQYRAIIADEIPPYHARSFPHKPSTNPTFIPRWNMTHCSKTPINQSPKFHFFMAKPSGYPLEYLNVTVGIHHFFNSGPCFIAMLYLQRPPANLGAGIIYQNDWVMLGKGKCCCAYSSTMLS